MSDLYLTLRRRLDEVAEWVYLGSDVMMNARSELGLSRETVGRQLHVSSKTYERWEKRGEVPRHAIAAVAIVLGLEIEQPARVSITLDKEGDPIEERLDRIEGLLAELLRARRPGH